MNSSAINSTNVCCNVCNTLISKFKVKKQSLLFLAFLFLGTFLSFSQTTGSCSPTNNPEFPTECDACIIVVLDESGSITSGSSNIQSQVKIALQDFVEALNDPCLDVSMAIVEYSSLARPAQIGASSGFQIVNDAYETNLDNYLNGAPFFGGQPTNPNYYLPGGGTNWDQGLRQAKLLVDNAPCDNPYIVMFTDGNPTYYGTGPSGPGNTTTTAVLEAACEAANELKADGNRIFTVALPNPSIVNLNVEAITDGASSLKFVETSPGSGETSNIRLADYLVTTQADIGDAFAALAAGIAEPTISTAAVSGPIEGFCPTITAPTFTVNHDCQNNATPTVVDSGVSIDGCEATQTWTASYEHTGVCPAVAEDVVITYTWFQDNEDPVISNCPNPIALGDDPVPGDLPTVSDAENAVSATDNCEIKSKVATAGQIVEDGCERTQTFNVVVTDNCDRTAECEVTYTWTENCCVPPTITCPSDINLQCDESTDPAFTGTATATEGCGNVSITFTDQVTPGVCAGNYIISRTWLASDDNQNSVQCTQVITVADTTPPVPPTPPADQDLQCASELPPLAELTAVDNCDGDITVAPTQQLLQGDCENNFTLIRTWTFVDSCGNVSSVSQTFNVNDTEAPVAPTPPADQDLQCASELPPLAELTAVDNCDGDITVAPTQQLLVGDCENSFTLIRTWTFVDSCGNLSSVSQTFNVNDTEAPVAPPAPASEDLQCASELPPLAELTAVDNCDGDITVAPTQQLLVGDCENSFTLIRTWTFIDSCGNQSSVSQTFNVDDTTPPSITAPDGSVIACDEQPVFGVPTYSDNCNAVTITSVDSETGNSCGGSFTRTWTATDACGNTASASQTFTYADTQAPEITCTEFTALFNGCADFLGPNTPNGFIFTIGDDLGFETAVGGTNVSFLDVSDCISDLCTDIEDLEVTLIASYEENRVPGCSVDIINEYSVRDACGNVSANNIVFRATITDSESPVLADPSPILDISCSDSLPTQETLAATDNCAVTVTPSVDPYTVDVCNGYPVTYRWIAEDGCGNTDEKSVTFNVLPSPELVLSCPIAVDLDSSSTQLEIETAYNEWKDSFSFTGGCEATDNLADFPSLPAFNCGTAVNLSFTYTVTDLCNPNGVSCTSTFFVPGVVGLTVDCPTDIDLNACTSQDDIVLAYNSWKSGFAVNDGDNPTSNIGDIPDLPNYVCGGAVNLSFTLTASDACNPNGVSCTSTFDVQAAAPLLLSPKPIDVTTDACEDPAVKFAQWISDLNAMVASGGCNASVDYSLELNTLSVDGYCNTSAQVVSVDIKAIDDCGETTPVTATFTVPAYTNDLALVGECPSNNVLDGCSTDAEISVAFEAWKTALLTNFSATGGCNAEVEYSVDVTSLQAPTQCADEDQVISVEVKAVDDCGSTTPITCSFTVQAFESSLVVSDVVDETYASCDFSSQDQLNIAFQDFLDKFEYTGGCEATGQFASAYSAPDLCAGGTVNVTYNVTDLCESRLDTASFIITPSLALEVSCPDAVNLGPESTVEDIQQAYDLWKLAFTKTEGCDATDNIGEFPSLPDSACDTSINLSFTFTAIDRCNPNGVSCSSTFSVEGSVPLDAGADNSDEFCGEQFGIDLFSYLENGVATDGAWTQEAGPFALDLNNAASVDFPDNGAGNFTLRYTVSSSVGICPSDSMDLTIAFDLPVDAGDDNSDEFCGEQFGIDLFSYLENGVATDGVWTQEAGPFALDLSNAASVDFPDNGAGNFALRYTLQSELGICPSDSMDLSIAFDLPVDAGDDNSDQFCGVQSGINLFDYLDDGVDQNGGWTIDASTSALDISNASSVDFPDNGAGSFTLRYTLSSELGVCENDFMILEISQDNVVDAGNDNLDQFCGVQSGINLFDYLDDGVDQNGGWTIDASTSALDISNASSVDFPDNGAGSFTLRYTLSSELGVCENDFMILEISQDNVVDAGNDNSDQFCGVQSGINLFDYLDDGVDQNGGWTIDASTSALDISNASSVDFPDNGAGSFTLRYTLSSELGVCENDFMLLEIAQDNVVSAGNDNEDLLCGSDKFDVDLFSYLDSGVDTNGGWTQISGPSQLDLSNAASVDFPDNGAGQFTLRYTLQSELGICEDDSMDLLIDFDSPVDAGESGSLTICADDTIEYDLFNELTGAETGGFWKDPNGNPTDGTFQVGDLVGVYTYTLESEGIVCDDESSTVNVVVNALPDVSASGGELTCAVLSVQLSGSSSTDGVTYSWSGPNGFTSSEQNPSVEDIGEYILTVTETLTGCTATASTEVTIDNIKPSADAGVNTELTCAILEVTLDGSGSSTNPDADLSYAWTGPNGFTADTEDITVSEAGMYILTVTDNDNGCTAMSDVDVSIDTTTPSADAGANAELTCTILEVTLDGSGSSTNPDADLSYEWSGPNGYNAVTEDITVSEVGTYTLTVTDNDNGCSAESSVEVTKEVIDLQLSYTDVTCFGLDDGTITVDFVTEGATVTVNGEPYDPDMLYVPGTYTVLAYFEGSTDEDCITSEVITIVEPALVDIQVSSTDVTCFGANDGTITIESLSEGAIYTIKLNGTGPDLSGQDFFAPGTYVVEASLEDDSLGRMSANGVNDKSFRIQNPCVDGKLVIIGEPERLMCLIEKGYKVPCNEDVYNNITVYPDGGVGPYEYSWSINEKAMGLFWSFDSDTNTQTISYNTGIGEATFTVVITDANGCTSTCQIELVSTCTKNDIYNLYNRLDPFDFEMFPNPTQGKLTIVPNRLSDQSATVELYNIIGTRLFSQSFNKLKENEIDLNFSSMPSQVYYLKVITKDGSKIKKVVIDK